MPQFSSVRAINDAVFKSAHGTLGGKYVYLRQEDGQLRRMHRAKTVKGDLFVRVFSYSEDEEWIGPVAWGQVITQ